MTQYNSVNVKLLNYRLDKLKSAAQNEILVTLRLSSFTNGNSNDETNFPHRLLISDRQISKLWKPFANNLLTNIKSSWTWISKIVQSRGFLGRFLGLLLKTGLPLVKNVLKQEFTRKFLVQGQQHW